MIDTNGTLAAARAAMASIDLTGGDPAGWSETCSGLMGEPCTERVPWLGAKCPGHTDRFYQWLASPIELTQRKGPRVNAGSSGQPNPANAEHKRRLALALAHVADCLRPFGLIHDVRADRRYGTKYIDLTDRQIDAILAHAEREATWIAPAPPVPAGMIACGPIGASVPVNAPAPAAPIGTSGIDLGSIPLGPSFYAVTNDSGALTFLRFRRIAADATDRWTGEPYRWAGWTFIDQQLSDEYQKRGRIDPHGTYVGPWPTIIEAILADPRSAMIAYGQAIGRCGMCGRTLTNEASREAGIGPECAAKS